MSVRIAVPVTASIGDEVRLQYAVLAPGGLEPGPGSKLWALAATVSTDFLPQTVHTPPLPTPSRVWIRLSGWEDGARVTNYTTAESFDLAGVPAVTDVILSVDDGGGVVTWDPGDHTEEVRIRWAVEEDADASPTWSAPEDVPAEPSAFAVPELPAMGSRVWVELTPMADAGATLGAAVVASAIRPLHFGTVMEPDRWLFTTDGHPVRDQAFRIVTEAGLVLPDDWILTTDGAPIRANDLEILRRST